MGKVLRDFGVKVVIAIKAEFTIQDEVATKAGPYIYNELMNGKSVNYAVSSFKEYLSQQFKHLCYFCCCEHDHEPDCPWDRHRKQTDAKGKKLISSIEVSDS
jgi:hypothetical protein